MLPLYSLHYFSSIHACTYNYDHRIQVSKNWNEQTETGCAYQFYVNHYINIKFTLGRYVDM